jgi:hypothetical protein
VTRVRGVSFLFTKSLFLSSSPTSTTYGVDAALALEL